ncbi:MAG TPA: GNAT family N-acetyltransferase [Streptomyces sp.]
MEIRGAGRLEVRITAADVGKRVSVRRFSDSSTTEGKFTDTVGVLTAWDDDVVVITRRDGEAVRIPVTSLAAGKVVPPAPARRRGPATSYEELSRVAARSWPPVESSPLGDWQLRAASGFTRRANSVLPLGSPGMPLDDALTAVRAWYAARGLPAYVQAGDGDALCGELEARGWVREVTARVMVGGLAPVADREAGAEVTLSREADEGWLRRYRRKGVGEVALRVLGGGASVWFATVAGRGEVDDDVAGAGESGVGAAGAGGFEGAGLGKNVPAAIGRCVVDGRWAGFSGVEVDPGRRREGLATTVMAALARRALEEGASAAWLQVEDDNAGALALYERLGFAVHHSYHHYREPA